MERARLRRPYSKKSRGNILLSESSAKPHLAGEPVLCAHAPNASWQAARRSDSAELIGSGRLRWPLRGGCWGCRGLLERGSKRVDKWMLNLIACAHK